MVHSEGNEYGKIVKLAIGFAVLFVLVIAGGIGYSYWQQKDADAKLRRKMVADAVGKALEANNQAILTVSLLSPQSSKHTKLYSTRGGLLVYKGELKDNRPHGVGEAFWATGESYSGDWIMGERTGYGVYKDKDSTFEGKFKNDEFLLGKFIDSDSGRTFVGYFKKGKPVLGEWR